MNGAGLQTWPAWATMWLLAACGFAASKAVSLRGSAAPGRRELLAYCLAWPGLDARRFWCRTMPIGDTLTVGSALGWLVGGSAVVIASAVVAASGAIEAAAALGFAGLILALHGGVFGLLTVAWQHRGAAVVPIMNAPWRSTTIAEFWGRRWNTAFSDVVRRAVLRPLASRIGVRAATDAVFGVSGLVHDAVISLPAAAGYGGPTLYFLLQYAALGGQRRLLRRDGRWGRGGRGRALTAAAVVVPLPLLFHSAFLCGVVAPFFEAIGAW